MVCCILEQLAERSAGAKGDDGRCKGVQRIVVGYSCDFPWLVLVPLAFMLRIKWVSTGLIIVVLLL